MKVSTLREAFKRLKKGTQFPELSFKYEQLHEMIPQFNISVRVVLHQTQIFISLI